MCPVDRQVAGVRFISLLERSGYGNAALEYLRLLLDDEIPIHWTPLVCGPRGYELFDPDSKMQRRLIPADLDPGLKALLHNNIDYQCQILHTVPELWPRLIDRTKRNIGYTAWETDRLPSHWPPLLQRVDRVLVPSEFNREIFGNSITTRVDVVPHVCRPQPEPASAEETGAWNRRYGLIPNNYHFYTINAWTPRKALWDMLHCYLLAFDCRDPVSLVIKTDPRGPRDGNDSKVHSTRRMVSDIIGNYPEPAHVVLIDNPVPEREIELMHLNCDCYLSLARSEGWGLGAFDAASLGNPVIITGWGGQLDYLPEELAYRVQFRLIPVEDARGYRSYSRDQNWARADVDHAIELLGEVFSNRASARRRGKRLQHFVREAFGAEAVRQKLIAVLGELKE